jgi:molybdopterin molybdotransferase
MKLAAKMNISYEDAISIIEREAAGLSATFQVVSEIVPLGSSLGRIVSQNYICTQSTPKWDTSAMDGFALNSEASQEASLQSPITFSIERTIAAGDDPISMSGEELNGIYPCVEIMTGAVFPTCVSGKPFDCCVRFEDTDLVHGTSGFNYVQIFKPEKTRISDLRAKIFKRER